ncbi:MAG TPA: redoxin domain-containing protein [Thermotogota bacterium]|nr:redoxin domain-containing protein [Thermotogota bacterium]HPJ88449.1 redoxin domain-containing protein [Thermotogota bacterium]HPR95384.1 redoxin domain-containing protein [Thermotogota bacterium]
MSNEIIKTGESFGEFELKAHDGKLFSSKEHKGKKILLSFHPLAWTSVCRDQMVQLDERYDDFLSKGVIPVGVSVDPVPSKGAWAESIGIKQLKLLSDFWPHGELAEKLGIFNEEGGFSNRVNLILDEDRKVFWSKIYPIKQVPDFQEVLDILK